MGASLTLSSPLSSLHQDCLRPLYMMLTTSSPGLLHKQSKVLKLFKEMEGVGTTSRKLTLVKVSLIYKMQLMEVPSYKTTATATPTVR